jgi:hypothetical protein
VSSQGQKEKELPIIHAHSGRIVGRSLLLLLVGVLECQALNQLIFIVLVDTNVSKCYAYISMIKYFFQRHRVVCLLVHVIAEGLPKGMCSNAVNPEFLSGRR